jgi:hypothetical protein
MTHQSNYWATRSTRPNKLGMWSIQVEAYHWGQNNTVLNRHRQGLPPWNLRIATARSPPFPFECSTFPYLPCLVTTTYMNININIASTHHIHHILLVYERRVLHVSGTYHSTFTDSYQLHIAYLVIKSNTSTTRIHMKGVLPCNLSHHHTRPYT